MTHERAVKTVGTGIDDAIAALEIAKEYDMVFASIGFHPHNARDVQDGSLSQLS